MLSEGHFGFFSSAQTNPYHEQAPSASPVSGELCFAIDMLEQIDSAAGKTADWLTEREKSIKRSFVSKVIYSTFVKKESVIASRLSKLGH